MAYYSDITRAISEMGKWQRAALATTCAATVSPIVMRFGKLETQIAFKDGLNACWKSVEDENIESLIPTILPSLTNLPESACDDSNSSDYEVMIGVSILAYAMTAVLEQDNSQSTRNACAGAVNFFSGCDGVLNSDAATKIVDPRNPPLPDPFESLQIDFQFHTITQLGSAKQMERSLLEQIRLSAQEPAARMNEVLPRIADRRGWHIDVSA
jgi:hypothetical protein